jgi:hypothetical protein
LNSSSTLGRYAFLGRWTKHEELLDPDEVAPVT